MQLQEIAGESSQMLLEGAKVTGDKKHQLVP